MQTVRACCRVLAACAAAFLSFSLEAATEHLVYPTPQNLSAKIEIYNSARSLLLSWDDVTISGDAPSEAVYFVACRFRTAGSTEAWSEWDETTYSVQIPRVGQWGGRAEWRYAYDGSKDWEYRVRCYNDFDYPDIYLSEWSETVRVSNTVDDFAFAGNVTSDHNLRRTYLNIPFSYTTSRTGASSTPLFFSFTAIEIPDDGRIFEAGTVRRDGTPLAVAKLDVIKSGEISGTRVGDPTNFALSSGDGRFSWSVDMDLGLDYYHTNVTIVVQGYEPAETEGGTPRKVVDKAIGGVTIDTRTPWFTPTANGRGIILEWQKVTDAAKYVIHRAKVLGDETTETIYTTIGETAETTYTDSNFPDRYYTTQRYYYRIQPLEADGTELFHSAWIPAYCRLDFLNADSVHFSPRFPWSGQLDFRIQNFSARDKRYDGLPRFKLTATHAGNPIPVRTVALGDGTTINPSDFTLVEDSPTNTMEWTRLVWDARADLGETNITSALDFKLEYIDLTTADGKPYVGDTVIEKRGPVEGLDTRLVPEVALDGRTTYVYADTGWWNPAAGYALVNIEGTQRLSTSGTGSRALTKDILPVWGTNTLTITTDRGESWTGYVKYPDFAFTVSEGNADGVTLAWNDIPGVTDYAVRRRPLGSDAAFETVETVTGATTWTDTTADEVGAYEYTVMPLLPDGADAGPAPAVRRGYRTLEKVAFVAARSDEPWTPRVAIDIAYTSGRVAATDGTVTYRLERTDGGPLTALTNDVGVAIDPANVALASGVTNRIWWSAEADLGAAAVVSDISLRLVPTLAADAPEGAVAAPAALTCEPFAVDFRPTRNVNVGDTVSVPWLWTRTDARNEADDAIRIDANTWVGAKTLLDSPVGADARVGTLSFPVTLEYWTAFTLVKHETNGGTDVATTSFVTYRLPAAAPQGLTATQGETNAVALAWSAVPQASGYHIVANYTDCSREPAVTYTRDWHTSGDVATNTVDEAAPALGYAHYTVTALYGNGARGPEATALGWRALDALELENVQTRKPWPSGRVDIDLVYTTARVTLRNRMGVSTPVPSITIAVQTAEGDALNVDSLVREPPVSAYTEHLDRRILTNGQLFSADDDSGSWRIVWDTASWDSPVPKLVATNAVLTVFLGDVVADTATFDLDTRRISRIPITADMETLPLRWATRWLEESPAMSLDLRSARKVRFVEIKDGVSNELASEDLHDEEGVFSWTPPTDVANEVTVRATYDGMEKNAFTLTFFQAPAVNATAQYQADANAFHVTWDAVVDPNFAEVRYALLRRVVNRDGSTGAWTTLADALAATTYDDGSVDPDDLTVYEYAVRVRYSDGAGGWLDAAPSAGAFAWAKAASLALSEPSLGAPWTATVGIDVTYATGQPVGEAADAVEVFAKDTVGNTNLTVTALTLDGVAVVNGAFTLDRGTATSTGRLVWNAGADAPEANLANVVLGVKTAGTGLEKQTAPFALDVRTTRDVAVGETIDIPWAWTRTDARDEADDTLVLKANLNGDWDWTNLCEIAVGAGPRAGVATVTVTDDLWTSFTLEKHEMNGDTDETTTSFVTYCLPAEIPQGVTASRDVTNAVTVTWSAVPQATGYKIVAEDCDAGGNRQTRPLSVSGGATTNYVDTASPVPGYTRYTVSAVYPNDAVGAASAAAIGWRSLDALTATVKTRTPWPSGKVDIDLSYETARHALRAAGEDVPTSLPLTFAVRKADGTALRVASLMREPMVVESTYTLNRSGFTNGQTLFSDAGATRIVWNAGADVAGTEAAGAVLSVALGDRVVSETTFDLDTRRQTTISISADAAAIPLRWAARWVDEDSTSLNMMDGHDVRLVEETADGTRVLFDAQSRDAEGVVEWTPPADAWGLITVKALYDGAERADYTITFRRMSDVVFDALGPWLDGGAAVVTQNVEAVYGTLPTATRAGYRLVGWFDGITNGAPEAVAGEAPLARGGHRLFAKWEVEASASPVVDAEGNTIFAWEAIDGTTARICGFRDANQRIANLILPDSIDGYVVTEIAACAVANSASGLASLTLPLYCETIGRRAFSGIKTLTRLTITPVRDAADPARAGALSVGEYAFTSTGLMEVFLPVEVDLIDDYAFADCRMLQNVTVLGRPTVGLRPFRRAGLDAGEKPTIHLHPDLASDPDYLAQITQEFGNDIAQDFGNAVFAVRTDAVVTGLSLDTLALPEPGTVRLAVGVERAAAWGEVDVSRLRVVYQEQLGDAPTDLVPRAVVREADGSLTVEVAAPEGPSGFFRVKMSE